MSLEVVGAIAAFCALAAAQGWMARQIWKNGRQDGPEESPVDAALRLADHFTSTSTKTPPEVTEKLASLERRQSSLEEDVVNYWRKIDQRARQAQRAAKRVESEEEGGEATDDEVSDTDRAALAQALGDEGGGEQAEETSDLDAVRRRIRERGA